MQPLPELSAWRRNLNPEQAEQQVRWLREQIAAADEAIEAQQRIIAKQGPLEAYLLSIESLRLSQRSHESSLAEIMKQREVELVDFALAGKRYDNHRASAKALSVFLDAMQRLYERVGQSIVEPRPSVRIPDDIRQICQLQVAGFFPSSFGIRFATETRADLTGQSLSGMALEATFDLLNAESPIEQAERVGPWAMTQYRHLVKTLIKAEATPKVNWRAADGQERGWITDDNTLLTLSNRLASIHDTGPRLIEAKGFLTGASLRRRKFEFAGDQGIITGRAPEEVHSNLTRYFGKYCTITYSETVFIDETTDQEKRARILLSIAPA